VIERTYDASRRDALVNPLNGGENWLFPPHNPPDVGGVRLAAAPQPDVQVIERSAIRRQGTRYRRLHLSPPNRALILSVDKKSLVQARDREQPMMSGVPERRTHSYVGHGTTALFAALDVASEFVIGKSTSGTERPSF
jgi:hypothetical protein